jgi:hypothetical protein
MSTSAGCGEIVDGPWPPIHLPPQPDPPPFSPRIRVRERASALQPAGIARVPESAAAAPRALGAGSIRAFNPQPDPPMPALTRQALSPLPATLVLAARAPRAVFRARGHRQHRTAPPDPVQALSAPRAQDEDRSVTTDDCGHFRGVIWRSCNNSDKPDLYFTARQRLFPAFWITIYEPTPVACHTYWNYACGTEVSLVTTHPFARVCPPCPPVVAPNNWVLFMAIGNTSVWRIHGANTTTRVGAPATWRRRQVWWTTPHRGAARSGRAWSSTARSARIWA